MVTEPEAYRFAIELADLDVGPLDQLLERSGEPATRQARRLVEESGRLVRGEVLAHERYASWAEGLRRTYRGRVRGAVLDAAQAALVARGYAAALAHAQPAITLDRFAEPAHRTAILALCVLGRACEAFDAASAVCSGANRRRRGTRGTHPMSAPTDVCSTRDGQQPGADSGPVLRPLDPMVLRDHIDVLYRAAWALCGSRHEAEDLVQDTFARVLRRPRLLRSDNEAGYLLRALGNTNTARHRAVRRRPITVPLVETDFNDRAEIAGTFDARELMEAIAVTPRPYRDAVVAVDVVGMSYRQAARHLRTREVTITSRLSRGRQHIARALSEPAGAHRGRRATDADRVSLLGRVVESSRDR